MTSRSQARRQNEAARSSQEGSQRSQPANRQSTELRPSTLRGGIEEELFDVVGDNNALLTWSNGEGDVIFKGPSDFTVLKGFKNALLSLRHDFGLDGQGRIIIQGENVNAYNQRLFLLEHEIEGLLKRRINFTLKEQGAERVLDYTGILNEKENQIVELEKKIQNYEERLRRTSAREQELENEIMSLRATPIKNEDLVRAKNDVIMAEIAHSTQLKEYLLRIRKNFDTNQSKFPADAEKLLFNGVVFPAEEDIKAEALLKDGATGRGATQNISKGTRTQIISMFREFERLLSNPKVTQTEFDTVLEGTLLGLEGSSLRETIQQRIERSRTEEQFINLRSQFSTAAGLFRSQLDRLRTQHPSTAFEFDTDLGTLLSETNVQISTINGITHVERFTERTVEVPVQDAQTKHLIHQLTVHLKKIVEKYPKLRDEIDSRLYEFFQQEVIDVIEVDELDRLVSIVKYVPQVVKVQNVYAYSSEKSRRVEFHLRVLIKALLEELQKLKLRTGAVLEIDEGIVGMINEEIMGVVNVDDILKVFRVVPKIVEVEKIIQKVVERDIEVPQIIVVEKIVEKIVEVAKIQEVDRIIHVPVEVIRYVDNVIEKIVEVERLQEKVVEVPKIIEKVIERIIEVPKIQQVTTIVEKIVEREVPVVVERVVNHTVPEIKEIEVIKEKIVEVERIVERIIEVPTIVEKIVEKMVQVPQIIEVEKVVEKVVKVVEYRNAKEIVNHIETVYQVVDRIVEKAIPVIQLIEKIVQVPQIIEKIVTVQVEVPTIHEVTVIEEKIVYVDRIKEVERIVNHVVPLIKEVEKIIDRRVEVPMIQEKIIKVPEIITQIVIERTEVPKIIEVEKQVEKIVEVTKLIEVEKPVNHYIREIQIQKVIVEKIVEVPRTVERLKEVRVNIDKIIEKMVEVPKVVEVEKIVEKIVVVPRVIQKIVEVVQIVEKLVDRIVEVQVTKEVEVIVQVPMIQEKIVEVEVIKNIYHEVEKVVERIVEKVVPYEKVVETVSVVEHPVEKLIEVKVEVPKEVQVEKIVTTLIEVEKVVELERPSTIAVEVPVPVDRIVEKVVQIRSEIEKVVQVPQIVEKIVQVKVEEVRIEEIERLIEKIVIEEKIKEVIKEVPYIQETIKEVPTVVERLIPVQSTVTEIQNVPNVVEKVVTLTNEIPRVYEVERLVEKIIQIPQIVELEVVTPMIVKVNQIIEAIREKAVEIPVIHQEIVQVPTVEEKVVQIKTEMTQVKEIVITRDKIVEVDRFVERTNTVNYVEGQIQIVDRFEERLVPVFSTIERIVEVPHILEKIVEKIVIMPQVVEVIKYVHEIVEQSTLGVAVGVDVSIQEAKYRQLYGGIRGRFDVVITELRKIRSKFPDLKAQIDILEKFLTEFNKLAEFQRIVQVDRERIVEQDKPYPVLVPVKDQQSIRAELSQSLLIERLISQIRRIRKDNPKIKFNFEDDINLIFFPELESQATGISEDLQALLTSYTDTVVRKFTSIDGNWTTDHELILSTVLAERFALADLIREANLSIQRANSIANQRLEGLRKYKLLNTQLVDRYSRLTTEFTGLTNATQGDQKFGGQVSSIGRILGDIQGFISTDLRTIHYEEETVTHLGEIHGESTQFLRVESVLRERIAENDLLRNRLIEIEKGGLVATSSVSISGDQTRIIQNLRNEITTLNNQLSELRKQSQVNVNITANTSEYEIKIRTLNSRIQELESQLRTVRIDYEGQLRTSKTESDKALREAQLRINDLERKISSHEREIENLSRRLQEPSSTKVTPNTPNTRIEGTGSVTSSNVGNSARQVDNTPTQLTSSQHSSESGTNRSSGYIPGQYTSSYGGRGSNVGSGTQPLGGGLSQSGTTGGVATGQTGRNTGQGVTYGQGQNLGGSGTMTSSFTESVSTSGVQQSGPRTGATYAVGESNLGGSGSRTSGVQSTTQSPASTYVPGQYSSNRRGGSEKNKNQNQNQ